MFRPDPDPYEKYRSDAYSYQEDPAPTLTEKNPDPDIFFSKNQMKKMYLKKFFGSWCSDKIQKRAIKWSSILSY